MGARPAHAVIFDFGRVLAHYDTRRTCRALSAFTKLSVEDVHAAIFTGHGYEAYRRPYEAGAFPCEVFFGHMRDHIGLSGLSFEDFRRHWPDVIGPAPGTQGLIARIPKSVRLGILSNIDRLNWEVAESLPLVHDNFPRELCVLSFEERLRKPDPLIFGAAATRVGIDPVDTVYIDDRDENVNSASLCGFRAEQYNCMEQPIGALEAILQKHGALR